MAWSRLFILEVTLPEEAEYLSAERISSCLELKPFDFRGRLA